MAINTDTLILRETNFPPLTNKNDFIVSAELDSNFIKIYQDFLSLAVTTGVDAYDSGDVYDDSINSYATYDGRLWEWIDDTPGAVTPGTDPLKWIEVFPTKLGHRKNSDTILAEGTSDAVTAAEIRAFIDAGLTTTTDLSITSRNEFTFRLNSSTGADVIVPQADEDVAGLLNAEDKRKLNQLIGVNTGDQTLASLNGEDLDNKAEDFSTINHTLYPTVEAVDAYVQNELGAISDTNLSNNDMLIDEVGDRYIALGGSSFSDTLIISDDSLNEIVKFQGNHVVNIFNASLLNYARFSGFGEEFISAKINAGNLGTPVQYALNVYSKANANSGVATMKNSSNQTIFDFRQSGNNPTLGLYDSANVEKIFIEGVNGRIRVSDRYEAQGSPGFTGTGSYTNFTIVGGIITNAT